jgi:tRNA threonylcarbamoyladenosine biosynthesis protein TsaE
VVHLSILKTLLLDWPDEAACEALARGWAAQAALRQSCIELHGPLGSGKTCFARHLLRALGVAGRIKSPSYGLMEVYTLDDGSSAWHFDLYRLKDPQEWEDAGFRDIFASPGLKLVEWPERAQGLLPVPDVQLALSVRADEGRDVQLQAHTQRGLDLIGSSHRE